MKVWVVELGKLRREMHGFYTTYMGYICCPFVRKHPYSYSFMKTTMEKNVLLKNWATNVTGLTTKIPYKLPKFQRIEIYIYIYDVIEGVDLKLRKVRGT